MRKLKSLPETAIPAALDKALRYRLLNEPQEAESIALDILQVDPENEQALVTLLLAISDMFEVEYGAALDRAKAVLSRLGREYDAAYFEGVVYERWAKAQAARKVPGHVVTGWYLHAMHCFERAEALASADNPDAILRWNTCARWLEQQEERSTESPSLTRDVEMEFGEDVPTR